MVRFKTRWLLLAIDDAPLSPASPFPTTLDSAHASTSSSILSAAQHSPRTNVATTLTPQQITRLLRASLVSNFGDVAAGAFGGVLTCKYYSSHTGTAIVRCSRDAARLVWASATMISSPVEIAADGETVSRGKTASLRMRVIHCGGTIKKVQNKAIELDRKMIMRMRAKQKRLAASSKAQPSTERAKVIAEVTAPVAVVPPTSSIDDDEDLGEALDPTAPSLEVPAVATQAPSQINLSTKSKSNNNPVDLETQALLAQSRREINSISM